MGKAGKEAEGKTKKKVVIRKVRIASGPPQQMGKARGRPKGALGKAKSDLLGMESGAMVA